MSTKKQVLEVNQEIVFREEDDGAFLFDPDTGRLCYLNELGVSLWKYVDRQLPIDEIIAKVAAEYPEVPDKQISGDCLQFIDDLRTFGFITNS